MNRQHDYKELFKRALDGTGHFILNICAVFAYLMAGMALNFTFVGNAPFEVFALLLIAPCATYILYIFAIDIYGFFFKRPYIVNSGKGITGSAGLLMLMLVTGFIPVKTEYLSDHIQKEYKQANVQSWMQTPDFQKGLFKVNKVEKNWKKPPKDFRPQSIEFRDDIFRSFFDPHESDKKEKYPSADEMFKKTEKSDNRVDNTHSTGFSLINQARAEDIKRGVKSKKTTVEKLVDPSEAFRDDGLYRVHDAQSGYIIYVLTTGNPSLAPSIRIVSDRR